VRPGGEASPLGRGLQPYVLYVGGHWAHKNVRRLLSAFRQLKGPDGLRLVLVGGGPVRNITEVIARLDLGDRVVLLRDLPDADLSSLYADCSVFVCPSLYEGFGLPVLEALAHGAPVACSNSSSLPEVAEQAAVYFDPRSVSDIAGQIQALLDNRALAGELRSAGPRQAARFSWERTAQEVHAIALRLAGQLNS
jgi:glycosyltransferase involved in cell wall biosynthesis